MLFWADRINRSVYSSFLNASILGHLMKNFFSQLPRRSAWPIRLFSALSLCLVAGCGGDDEFDIGDGGDTEIRDISFQDEVINVGEGTVAFFEFDFDNFDVQRGDDIFLTVRLPAGTSFRDDSAEIDGSFDDDERVRPTITQCGATGETFLFFTLDDSDLGSSDSSFSSDATLKLTIDANRPGQGLVAANASESFELPDCDRVFESEEVETLTVR